MDYTNRPSQIGKPSLTIGVDGDDTLWYSEIIYEQLSRQVKTIFSKQLCWDDGVFTKMLYSNISLMGYGMKTYSITLLEYILSYGRPANDQLLQVINLSKNTWGATISLYKDAKDFIEQLSAQYKVVLITQGDSSEQKSKIDRSGIVFNDIEIVPQKDERTYIDLLSKRSISTDRFIMIGNSFKSDIVPVLNIGAKAIYVKSRWQFEKEDDSLVHTNLFHCLGLNTCLDLIKQIDND